MMSIINVTCTCLLFSYTFERVQENSEKLWRFQRYTVINDYNWRIPSPINLIFLPYRFFCCLKRDHCHLDWCKGMLYCTIYTIVKIWQGNSFGCFYQSFDIHINRWKQKILHKLSKRKPHH